MTVFLLAFFLIEAIGFAVFGLLASKARRTAEDRAYRAGVAEGYALRQRVAAERVVA